MNNHKIDMVLAAIDRANGSLFVYDQIAAHNLTLARNDVHKLLTDMQRRINELEDTVNIDEMRQQWREVCEHLDVNPEDPDKVIDAARNWGKVGEYLSHALGLKK